MTQELYQLMPDEKKMLCLGFDGNNFEFSYLVGLSIWIPAIALAYCGLKFLLKLLTDHPQKISLPRQREIELVKNKNEDASQPDDLLDREGQQAVLLRFRQRQKKIQREITKEVESESGVLASELVAKEGGSYVSKEPRVRDGDQEHFSHRHPLLRFHLRGTEAIRCNICTYIVISGVAYGCDHCHYFLHEVCSNIPKRIRHDFHPMHSLNLLPIPSFGSKTGYESRVCSEFHCVACGYDNSYPHHSLFAFYYHCDLCKFDIHLECASVPTTLINKVKYSLDLFSFFPLESEGAALICDICNQVMDRGSSWLFYNREFDYICHFECAAEEEFGSIGDDSFRSEVQKLLVLRKSYPGQQPKLELGEVTHFSHRHPLKPFKPTDEASILSCCICSNQSLSGYICLRCNYFICDSCFPFPRKIQHHYHPNHPLILASYTEHPEVHCLACTQEFGAAYHCSACKFSLHRSCAGAPMTLTLGTSKKVTYTLIYSCPYECEMADIKCSQCTSKLKSTQSLYYNFDLDDALHVQCALGREADSYATKSLLACERLKSSRIE